MEIYSPAISSAAAEYISTINSKTTGGEGPYGRGSRQRLMNLDVPDAAIVEMEKSRKVPIGIEWTSPRDGVVLERNAIEGMRAQPGAVLFQDRRSCAGLGVDRRSGTRSRCAGGGAARDREGPAFPAGNSRQDRRHLSRDQQGDANRARSDRTPNPDLALLHGMYVDADINIGSRDPVLTIPESAVMDAGRRQAVFVDKGEGRFEPREVKLGQRGDGYVEVRQGIIEGEPVVVSANFLIDAESNLKAALKGFSDGAQP